MVQSSRNPSIPAIAASTMAPSQPPVHRPASPQNTTTTTTAAATTLISLLTPPSALPTLHRALRAGGPVLGLAAIQLNHARRVLSPPPQQQPLDAMKLARTSPHHFLLGELEGGVGVGLAAVVVVVAWGVGWRAVRMGLERCEEDGRRRRDGRKRKKRGWMVVVRDVLRVLDVMFALAWAEYAYGATCHTICHLTTLTHLSLASPTHSLLLRTALLQHLPQAALTFTALLYWLVFAVVPEARAAVRRPALLLAVHALVWGGTAHLVRHSSRYFVLLEVAGMGVTFGWMGLGVVVWWFGGKRGRGMW